MGKISRADIKNKKEENSRMRVSSLRTRSQLTKKSISSYSFTSILKFNIAAALFILFLVSVKASDFIFDNGNAELQKDNEVYLSLINTEAGGRQYALVSAGSLGGIGVGKFSIFDKTAGVSRLTVDVNGNVGIGTTNSGQKLTVAGIVESTSGGFKFPDGTTQASAGGSGGGVPTGTIAYFDSGISCPSGWMEVTETQGRYIVGLPSGGTLGGTVGQALTNLENRATGQHSHNINDPGHRHIEGHSTLQQNPGYSYTNQGNGDPNYRPTTDYATTGITVLNTGAGIGPAGTNAPYIQLRVCKYVGNGGADASTWGTSGNNIYNLNNGSVGIGTTNPQAGLEVANGLRLTPTSLPSGIEGELRYNSATKALHFRSSGGWKRLAATAPRGGGASMSNSGWINVDNTWTAPGPVYIQGIRVASVSHSYCQTYLNGGMYSEGECTAPQWITIAADCDNGNGGCTVQFSGYGGNTGGNYVVYYFPY